jgi:sec-independent protein translocase protein TatB
MFDIAWSELLLVAIVAILVVGPKELPGMLRALGRMLGKLRSTADDFRKQFDEAVREAGAEDLQREVRSLRKNNPLNQIKDSIEDVGRNPLAADKKARAARSDDDDEDDMDDGELPPPPPLPPKNAPSVATGSVPGAAGAGTTAPEAGTTPQPASPASSEKDEGGGDLRLNGEHRTLN